MYEEMVLKGHQELANKFMNAMAALIAGFGTQFQDCKDGGVEEHDAVEEAKNGLIAAGYDDAQIAMLEEEAWNRYL